MRIKQSMHASQWYMHMQNIENYLSIFTDTYTFAKSEQKYINTAKQGKKFKL